MTTRVSATARRWLRAVFGRTRIILWCPPAGRRVAELLDLGLLLSDEPSRLGEFTPKVVEGLGGPGDDAPGVMMARRRWQRAGRGVRPSEPQSLTAAGPVVSWLRRQARS